MKKKNMFNEYDVSNSYNDFTGMNTNADFQRTFSRSYDNGKGISLFLQYGTKSNFREYDLQTRTQPGFAEYEVVSSNTNNRSFNKAASVKEYTVDLNTDNNFYVEPFDQDVLPAPKNPGSVPIPPQQTCCPCPSPVQPPNAELPNSPNAGAIPLSQRSAATSRIPKSTSGNRQTNKILNAISQMESSSSTGDEISDGFLEDMKTILTDPKIARQQSAQSQTAAPAPQPTKEEDIFDRIAKNMQYANQYDFGTMELEKRFDDFDKIEDSKLKVPVRSNARSAGKTIQTASVSSAAGVSSSEFLQDMDLMNMSGSKSAPIPLDPGVGGRSILPEVLEVGDIILSTTTDPISEAIRSATGSEVSHASIYVGNGRVIHSTDVGVQEWTLDQLMNACSLCVAYHHRDMDGTKAGKIVQFLRTALDNHAAFDGWGLVHAAPSQLMASYCDSLSGAARTACLNSARSIQPGTDNNDQFFCSELIFAALKEAGLTISTVQPSFSSPQEAVRLFYDGTLQYVGHLKV